MKKTAGLFLVALLAGAVTLGAYKLFFDQPTYRFIGGSEDGTVVNTSAALPAAALNIDFTEAAQKTVHAVVHVKNVTTSRSSGGLLDFWYGNQGGAQPQVGTGSGCHHFTGWIHCDQQPRH